MSHPDGRHPDGRRPDESRPDRSQPAGPTLPEAEPAPAAPEDAETAAEGEAQAVGAAGRSGGRSAATLVAAGILSSRLVGLGRHGPTVIAGFAERDNDHATYNSAGVISRGSVANRSISSASTSLGSSDDSRRRGNSGTARRIAATSAASDGR